MLTKETADEKVGKGWLRIWMAFEALAVNEETVKKSLENLVDKLDTDDRVKLYKKEYSEAKNVKNPVKGIEEGYSQVVEVELITKKLSDIVGVIIEYGPSAAEVMEPKSFDMDAGEAQIVLNTIADMMHKFAAAGLGGFVLVRGKE